MLDDHLLVEIGYTGKEVPQRCIGLRVNFFLGLWYRFWFPRVRGGQQLFCADLGPSLLDNRTSNMVADSAHLKGEIVGVDILGRLVLRSVVKTGLHVVSSNAGSDVHKQ
jgi:hypothetical protein